MHMPFLVWLDIIAAMALILALGSAYARLRRWTGMSLLSQLALGACFGCVAGLEMYQPLEPFDGVIVDLRNIPIALAGAFLRKPGAVLTLAIAVSVRAGIGGAGMWSGIAGMMIAATAGCVWQAWHDPQARRSIASLILLALMTSLHLVAAVLLPKEVFIWFVSEAALTIFVLNMLTIPLVAAFIEAERRGLITEQRLRESVQVDPETGLLPLAALQRECTIRETAMADGSFSHAAVLRLRATHVLSCWSRPGSQKLLMAAMRLRLQQAFPKCDLASLHGASTLVLPLTQSELVDFDATRMAILRTVTEDPYTLNGGAGHRISVDLDVVRIPATLEDKDKASDRHLLKRHHLQARWRRSTRQASIPQLRSFARPYQSEPLVETLFEKANILMSQQSSGF